MPETSPFLAPFPLLRTIDKFVDMDDFRPFPIDQDIAPGTKPEGTGLEVCSRPAFGLPAMIADFFNITHPWLVDGDFESGMGGGFFDPTMVDHGDQSNGPNTVCGPVEEVFPEHANVDVDCVREMMTPGGLDLDMYGYEDICKDTVENILAACDPDTVAPVLPPSMLDNAKRTVNEMLFGPPSLEDVLQPSPKIAPGT
jgi:hypothetical protein